MTIPVQDGEAQLLERPASLSWKRRIYGVLNENLLTVSISLGPDDEPDFEEGGQRQTVSRQKGVPGNGSPQTPTTETYQDAPDVAETKEYIGTIVVQLSGMAMKRGLVRTAKNLFHVISELPGERAQVK